MIEGGRRPDHAMSAAFLTMPSLRGSRERNEVVEARLWDAGALRVCRAQERPAGASHVVHNRECVAGYEVWDDSPRHSLGCRRCSWFCEDPFHVVMNRPYLVTIIDCIRTFKRNNDVLSKQNMHQQISSPLSCFILTVIATMGHTSRASPSLSSAHMPNPGHVLLYMRSLALLLTADCMLCKLADIMLPYLLVM